MSQNNVLRETNALIKSLTGQFDIFFKIWDCWVLFSAWEFNYKKKIPDSEKDEYDARVLALFLSQRKQSAI